jgi:M6 family metalloprotease-like protein
MKKIFCSVWLFVFFVAATTQAAPLRNVPQTLIQANGDTLSCFASGDEFFHYLHDAAGYTIVQDSQTGNYVYAVPDGSTIKASAYIAGKVNPEQLSLQKRVLPSEDELRKIVEAKRELLRADQPSSLRNVSKASPSYERNQGTLNNLVVFIRFSNENEAVFTQPISYFDNICNTGSTSMRAYFNEVSYGLIDIPSTYYPAPNGNTVLSYIDSHPRGYYQPYSVTNTIGYTGGANGGEYTSREHTLLANAISSIASQVPADLNIDMNNDGNVDNVSFLISGYSGGGWSDLLWPHRWMLYSTDVKINNKRVYDYLLIPVDTRDLDVSTLCHETFHALGAPDLYHYYDENGLTPVYSWDIMEYNTSPPQHMGAYMKYKYGNWISEIPTITPGKYTLSPLNTSSTNNCYKIPIPGNSRQFYVVEYRKRPSSGFERPIPGSGLIIYRIDTRFDGNADYNGTSRFDEIYVFRPGGTQTENGTPTSAYFTGSGIASRKKFNKTTNPRPWVSKATNDDYTSITEISTAGETISFVYGEYDKVAYIEVAVANEVEINQSISFSATVHPSDVSNKNLTWSVINGTGRAHIENGNLIGDMPGTVTLKAEAEDGSTISASKEITVTGTFVSVTSIAISAPDTVVLGELNSYSAEVLPSDASNKTLVWEVINGTGSAHLEGDSFIGDTSGKVTLVASAQYNPEILDSKEIDIEEISTGLSIIGALDEITGIEVYTLSGVKILEQKQWNKMSFDFLPKGAYIVKAWNRDKTQKSIFKIIN